MDKKAFYRTFLINTCILLLWYALEWLQFGELQHHRICDDIVFVAYAAVTYILLHKLNRDATVKMHDGGEAAKTYIAVMSGPKGPLFLTEWHETTDNIMKAWQFEDPEDAWETAKEWNEMAWVMKAESWVRLTPVQKPKKR